MIQNTSRQKPGTFHHKKSLGQHFLKDTNIVRKIVSLANIADAEKVWEIGPGKGILTAELLAAGASLTCFEIDDTLYPHLDATFENTIKLIKQDVLKADWEALFPDGPVKIVANLPYQITSPFLFRVAKYALHFSAVVVMIQKEVAQRITASCGTKEYSTLSLKMQYYFDVTYGFTVKPNVFVPPPKVDSAVILLSPRKNRPPLADEALFWRIVETAFGNRRKMLRRNLRALVTKEQLEVVQQISGIDLCRRGETLSEAEFIQLMDAVLGQR
ncbi:MAG: ribosomal RNA small subunit methyltransferase A [Candidatus Cloacimonetes bacterium]|nr:ribosomal RNA small subunit methyltransferase A [Candidatus Cloacimonadota bacterium]